MPKAGLEPARLAAPPPQDGVSANSTTSAFLNLLSTAVAHAAHLLDDSPRSIFFTCSVVTEAVSEPERSAAPVLLERVPGQQEAAPRAGPAAPADLFERLRG